MKKAVSLMLVLVMVLSALVGCNSSTSQADTLTVAADSDAISLDPMGSNDNASSRVNVNIYEGLFDLAGDGKEIPLLAESYEVDAAKTHYTFKIKQGVKFHNGDEMKASDVVFSLKRACVSPNVLHLFSTIDPESIKADDDNTVSFNLKAPFAGIISAFMHPGGSILSEKVVTEAEKAGGYGQQPIGTGPFKMTKWTKADSIELDRFEDYHGEKAGVSKVIFKVIPEAGNRLIELESGTAQIALEVQPIDIQKIKDNDKLALYQGLDYGTTYLGFNTKKAPFDNAKVREAISYAIDMPGIIEKVWLGVGQVATNSMPPTMKYSIADQYQAKTRDVEKAKALLAEAGFADGFTCTLSTNERKQRIDMATIIKEQLSEVGINVEVKVMEWSAYNDLLKNGEQDMFEIAWIADTPDPDTFLFPCFHSSAQGEGGNYIYLEDAELDKILEDARAELDDAKRGELYKNAQERIHEITAWVPQYNQEISVGAAKEVKGLELTPFGYFKLNKITIGE